MVEKAEGQRILKEIEKRQLEKWCRAQMIRAVMLEGDKPQVKNLSMDLALIVKLREIFPQLPEEVLDRVVPRYDQGMMDNLGAALPWNRRKRRRFEKADNVVVHFYAGDSGYFWEKALNDRDTEVLCIDLLSPTPSNMMDPAVFWFVMSLMMSGRVKAILAGPPCRTVSALRYQQDQGPGVLRSSEHPYGCPGISEREAELVLDDSALFLRVFFVKRLDKNCGRKPHQQPWYSNNQKIRSDTGRRKTSRSIGTCLCGGLQSGLTLWSALVPL